jgi:acetylornithine deacetylase/succinyl-diaminopimelate desuccinylase-like protein
MRKIIIIVAASFVAGLVHAQDHSSYYAEPYQKQALEIYRDSIGFHTAKSHGQVPVFADYLAGVFRAGGFADDDIHVLLSKSGAGENLASLVVTYRGDGSSGKKPVLLLAHMDVVEALAKDWERDPFTLTEEDGYFFGRGTVDDKFGTTVLTATFLRLKTEGFVPTRDLIIAFSGDEETGAAITTQSLVGEHRHLTDAEFALNADAGVGILSHDNEAIAYQLEAAEKTYATFELTIRNPGGHSSKPRADNAIYELASVLKNIESYRFPVRSNDITRRYFEMMANVIDGEIADAMRRFAKYPLDEEAADILYRYPAYVGITRTTCVATMLDGGHAENALPQSATATVNCRIFPGVEVADVRAVLKRVANNEALEIRTLGHPSAGPASPLREDLVSAVSKAVHTRYPDVPVIPTMASWGTDGKYVRIAGIPTYGVMGLFIREEDNFLHGLNERLPVKSFFGALEHWYVMLHELAGH